MRDIVHELERLQLDWYLTGSEALAAYSVPRQTMDTDLIVDADPRDVDGIAERLAGQYYYSEPLRSERRYLASLIDRTGAGKTDLIMRDRDAWGESAMRRRRRWEHPTWGTIWNSSLEDLILAKLEWSDGTSELQLRDCSMLLRMNAAVIDDHYLDEWSAAIGVASLLRSTRKASRDAS